MKRCHKILEVQRFSFPPLKPEISESKSKNVMFTQKFIFFFYFLNIYVSDKKRVQTDKKWVQSRIFFKNDFQWKSFKKIPLPKFPFFLLLSKRLPFWNYTKCQMSKLWSRREKSFALLKYLLSLFIKFLKKGIFLQIFTQDASIRLFKYRILPVPHDNFLFRFFYNFVEMCLEDYFYCKILQKPIVKNNLKYYYINSDYLSVLLFRP